MNSTEIEYLVAKLGTAGKEKPEYNKIFNTLLDALTPIIKKQAYRWQSQYSFCEIKSFAAEALLKLTQSYKKEKVCFLPFYRNVLFSTINDTYKSEQKHKTAYDKNGELKTTGKFGFLRQIENIDNLYNLFQIDFEDETYSNEVSDREIMRMYVALRWPSARLAAKFLRCEKRIALSIVKSYNINQKRAMSMRKSLHRKVTVIDPRVKIYKGLFESLAS